MKYMQWNIAQGNEAVCRDLRAHGVPDLLALVFSSRGVKSVEEARAFLSAQQALLCDPLLLRDMEKACQRIHTALARGETIAVFGDYDVDGITSTCLLTQYLRSCGGSVCYYIPCRLEEGYGLSTEAIDQLSLEGVSLIITVDCGITAVQEVDYARTQGIEVIITDHHECKETLPAAAAVIDPHRPDCSYPFPDLAGVGVALKLVLALAGPAQHMAVLNEYADLVALGTVADVMRLLGENRALVHLGLKKLRESRRVGLRALLQEAGSNPETLNSTTIGFCLAPRINAAGRMGKASLAAELILTEDPLAAERYAHELCALNRERQGVELAIFEDCIARLGPDTRQDCIVLAAEGWHQGVVGIVASRLAERYACPAFMISLQDGQGKGSCRSYGGFHLFAALESCQDLLEGFGGHAMAAGFTILEENIDRFRERLRQLVREQTGGEEVLSSLAIDVALPDSTALTVEGIDKLSLLEPYGNGNPKPVFFLEGLRVACLSACGGGRHLKLRLLQEGHSLDAIFFSVSRQQSGLQTGDLIDLAFSPQVNEFRGLRSVQLHLLDLRPSAGAQQNEQEALYTRFCQGERVSAALLQSLIPAREDFASLWRYLERCGGVAEESCESLSRATARLSKKNPCSTRTRICLDVFEECGLVQLEQLGPRLRVRSRPAKGKTDLEQSSLMQRLRQQVAQEESACIP